MLRGLLVLLLVSLNLGGLFSLILQLGRGEWLAGLGTLAVTVGLNLLGFWLLRETSP